MTMMMNRKTVAWMALFMAVWSLLNLHYTRLMDEPQEQQQEHDHPEKPLDYTVVGPRLRADDRPPRRPRLGAVAQGLGQQSDEVVQPPPQRNKPPPPQTTFVYFDGGAFRKPATLATTDHDNPHAAVDNSQTTAAAPLASNITPPKPRRPPGDQDEHGTTGATAASSNVCEWRCCDNDYRYR
jgi:hypothetical protein